MVISSRGAGFGWGGPLDDEIHKLIEMVTELGIEVEDILFNGAVALLGEGIHGAQSAQKACEECEARYRMAHQFGLDLLMNGQATPDQARWILELQEISQAFRNIAQEAKWIATQSLVMQYPVEEVLAQAGAAMNLLEYLVEQTRMHMRNSILYSTSRVRTYARMILEDDRDLLHAYMILETRLHEAIRAQPRVSYPMQQLLGIATRLNSIGRSCNGIASSVLYDPPNQHP